MCTVSSLSDHELRAAYLHTCLTKADGSALFVSDIRWPDMLEGAIVRAPVPRCRLLHVDTEQAKALPGVRAVVTASDLTAKLRIGKTIEDQDFLCGSETYGLYDTVALVAADSREQATAGVAAVALKYEELPAVYGLEQAMSGKVMARPDIVEDSNLLAGYHYAVGDTAAALSNAYLVLTHRFSLSPIEHCYLENDCAAARFMADGSLEVYLGCHSVTGEQQILSDVLGLPLERVRVIQPYMGGSFGGKDDGLIAVYAALLARTSGRPVRLWIDRQEEMVFHTKRHGQRLQVRMGMDESGRILGAEYEIKSDSGSSSHHGANIFKFVSLNVCGPYTIPAVKVDTEVYYTNGIAMGAMRSWGMTGITFATETMLNLAAARLGMDPLKVRRINAAHDGDLTLSGCPLPPNVRYDSCLNRLALLPLAPWPEPDARYARGVGYAGASQGCNLHFGYRDQSTVRLAVAEDGHINIQVAANDLGQGLGTTLLLIVSRALGGYPLDKLHYQQPDTTFPEGGPTGASRQTTSTGNAAHVAALRLRQRLQELGGEPAVRDPQQWLSRHGRGLTVEGSYLSPLTSPPDENGQGFPISQYGYNIQRAQVLVDLDTGRVRVLHLTAVCDCGSVVNRIGAEGQVQGAIAQGMGMALMEEFQQRDGRPLQHGFSEYLFPTAEDVPAIAVHFLDQPADIGYLHVKGLAELSITATAPAIVAAIYNATGKCVCDLPATPERVLTALTEEGR